MSATRIVPDTDETPTVAREDAPRTALPVALFSIPLGLAGLGGAWAAASQLLGASEVPAVLAYAASTLVWLVFTLFVLRGDGPPRVRSIPSPTSAPTVRAADRLHPVIAVLLLAHYSPDLGAGARWLCYLSVAVLAVNAAALLAHWLMAPLAQDALHPGYYLPLVAGPFIASIGLAAVGNRGAAIAAFGVGGYFWLLLGAVITGGLFFGGPLPQPFVPVLSILLSPPATASLAWFAIAHGQIDPVQAALGGVTLFTLWSQLFFLPDYLRLPFSSQHWVFTFPLAVLGNIGIRWAAGSEFTGWEPVAWTTLAVSTAAILAVLGGTLLDCGRWLRRRRTQWPATP